MLRIKELREERNIEQKVLAYDMKVSQPTVSDWENERKLPSMENIIKLADYFHVSVDYLIGRSTSRVAEYPTSVEWNGWRLREYRNQRHETPRETALAAKLSLDEYLRLEQNMNDPTITALCLLSDHFCLSTDLLLGRLMELAGRDVNASIIRRKDEIRLISLYNMLPEDKQSLLIQTAEGFIPNMESQVAVDSKQGKSAG